MSFPIDVVILAAGLGTRMRSRKAKVLHEAGGLTLVEHVVRTALQLAPPEQVAVIVGHQAERVRERLAPYGVRFALQTEQRGTGHALTFCRSLFADSGLDLLVLYGDTPLLSAETLRQAVRRQQRDGLAATVITAELPDPTGYGRILLTEDGHIRAIVEQKAATAEEASIREINSGIYCFRGPLLWPRLERLQPNPASGELYLTDVVGMLHEDGHQVGRLLVRDYGELLGINTRLELAEADRLFRERKVRELMLAGVTIEKPETVTIDLDVRVGMDSVIEPFAQLRGSTVVGEECHIGAGSIVRDSTLGDGVVLNPYTLVATSQVGERAHLGPFARLRMQNQVAAEAHIGNFVELKKTRFGRNSKAMHLAYLGDAVVGEGVNVGAGTITCNYDGVRKHATRIEDGAFVGSNSTLVAPVEVGTGSYVAAGSVVTHAVPEEALALGRSRQVNKEGWARRRREKKAQPA